MAVPYLWYDRLKAYQAEKAQSSAHDSPTKAYKKFQYSPETFEHILMTIRTVLGLFASRLDDEDTNHLALCRNLIRDALEKLHECESSRTDLALIVEQSDLAVRNGGPSYSVVLNRFEREKMEKVQRCLEHHPHIRQSSMSQAIRISALCGEAALREFLPTYSLPRDAGPTSQAPVTRIT